MRGSTALTHPVKQAKALGPQGGLASVLFSFPPLRSLMKDARVSCHRFGQADSERAGRAASHHDCPLKAGERCLVEHIQSACRRITQQQGERRRVSQAYRHGPCRGWLKSLAPDTAAHPGRRTNDGTGRCANFVRNLRQMCGEAFICPSPAAHSCRFHQISQLYANAASHDVRQRMGAPAPLSLPGPLRFPPTRGADARQRQHGAVASTAPSAFGAHCATSESHHRHERVAAPHRLPIRRVLRSAFCAAQVDQVVPPPAVEIEEVEEAGHADDETDDTCSKLGPKPAGSWDDEDAEACEIARVRPQCLAAGPQRHLPRLFRLPPLHRTDHNTVGDGCREELESGRRDDDSDAVDLLAHGLDDCPEEIILVVPGLFRDQVAWKRPGTKHEEGTSRGGTGGAGSRIVAIEKCVLGHPENRRRSERGAPQPRKDTTPRSMRNVASWPPGVPGGRPTVPVLTTTDTERKSGQPAASRMLSQRIPRRTPPVAFRMESSLRRMLWGAMPGGGPSAAADMAAVEAAAAAAGRGGGNRSIAAAVTLPEVLLAGAAVGSGAALVFGYDWPSQAPRETIGAKTNVEGCGTPTFGRKPCRHRRERTGHVERQLGGRARTQGWSCRSVPVTFGGTRLAASLRTDVASSSAYTSSPQRAVAAERPVANAEVIP